MSEPTPAKAAPKTPNEELADLVVAALKRAELITDRKMPEITQKVASGTAKQDDWLGWIEQAIDQKAKGKSDGQA